MLCHITQNRAIALLIVLVCFPSRQKRLLQNYKSEHIAEMEALSKENQRSGYRFLLTLVPLGVLFVGLIGFFSSLRSNIDSAEWKAIAPAGTGFQAMMPGTPRLEQQTMETPTGNVELRKFTVEPKGKKEVFMIVSFGFPEGASDQLGGTEKVLEVGRKDVLAASQGQLQSERQVSLSGHPGLELEVLPPKGAIIKARIYATKNQLYEVVVIVPRIRLASKDVEKFFDSFQLSVDPGATPERGGR